MIRSLLDCLSVVIDRRGVTPKKLGTDWSESGYRVLSANNIKTSGIQNEDEIRFVDEETYRKWMKEEIRKGDILLTSEAPAGEVLYWDSDEKIVAGQRIFILRTKEDVNPLYLKYYLQSSKGQNEIKNKCSGSTVFGISAKTFENIEIVLPSTREEQDQIADLLYSCEKKMQRNNDIGKQLEAMAKDIYDYWFLQFDFPNEEGKPYKSSGGKMAWNEELKCEIPEGWESKKLSEISKMKMNSVLPQENTLYRHYSIPAFDEKKVPILEQGKYIASNKYIVPNDAILVSKLNPQFKRIWLVEKEVRDGICSTEFIPFVSVFDNKEFLYLLMNSEGFYKFMVQSSSSSTGSRKRMQPELMGEYKLAYPQDDNILSVFKNMIQPNLEKMIRIRDENQELIALRDFLLPLLMNGQVGFKG